MGCLKLTEYKQKLPRRWTVLCRDFRQKNTINYNYQFDYDNIGNRIFAENNGARTDYTTNELNQYTTENTFIPTYDDDGNQTKIKTSMGEWLVEYNGENRPVKFTQGTKTIEMKYDYMGRRVQYISKTGNTLNKDRRYMYNGYTLVQEMYNTNQVYMEFTWDPTAGTATKPLMLAFPTEGKNLFYFHDANKNVTEVAYMATHNGIGAHYEYDTFGNIITNTRNSLFNFDSNNINPFRFSSEYFDSELGLIYYNYRHYNPQSGRWLSRDPIEEKGGNNLYGMCKNNTIMNIDLRGLLEISLLFSYIDEVFTGAAVHFFPSVVNGIDIPTEDGNVIFDNTNLSDKYDKSYFFGLLGFEPDFLLIGLIVVLEKDDKCVKPFVYTTGNYDNHLIKKGDLSKTGQKGSYLDDDTSIGAALSKWTVWNFAGLSNDAAFVISFDLRKTSVNTSITFVVEDHCSPKKIKELFRQTVVIK